MIKVALAHNPYNMEHLVDVMKEMEKLGPPTIRIVHVENNLYQAIEGCHRLRAAAALGLTPEFEELDADTLRSDVEGLDYHDGLECDEDATIGGIGDWENTQLIFEY
jgi:hypothetical protein